ncbi:MAG: hypothetical protein LLG20_18545 [Acidobacteriales bacterium]|nr:hypothetical protein [Terriglobales bacterium]
MPFEGALTVGAISSGSSILGGLFGKNAAKKAAQIQADAAAKVGDQASQVAGEYAQYINNEAHRAAGGVEQGVVDANGVLQSVYDTAGDATNPYRQAGAQAVTSLADLMSGSFAKAPTMADLQLDPGFDFRLQQGQKALEASAAARGSSLGGAALKSLARYSQGVASDEYAKAFDRFQADRTSRYNMFAGLAGIGQNATSQYLQAGANYGNQTSGNIMEGARTAGGFRTGGAQSVADLIMRGQQIKADAVMGGANARASGVVGGTNALWSGITGAANNAQNLFMLDKYGPPWQQQPLTYAPTAVNPTTNANYQRWANSYMQQIPAPPQLPVQLPT